MPLAPEPFPDLAGVTAKQLNTALYEFEPGSPFTPNGIAFHANRPLLVEGLIGSVNQGQGNMSLAVYGDWKNYFDNTALYGVGADDPYDTASGQFNPYVPGSSGAAGTAGGYYLCWGFASWAAAGSGGMAGVQLNENGTLVPGAFQRSSTVRSNAPYVLDVVEAITSQYTSLTGSCADSSGDSYAYRANLHDYSGELARFYATWMGVQTGGTTVSAVSSPASWDDDTEVTSALLNGAGIAGPLQLLNNPPLLRAGASLATSIGAGTATVVPVNAAQIDTYSAYSTSSHEWTVPLDGVYLVHGAVYWNHSVAGNVYAGFRVGAANFWGPAYYGASGGASTCCQVTRLVDLHAGDTLQLITFADDAQAIGGTCRLIACWMGALASGSGSVSWTPPQTGYRWQAGTQKDDLVAAFQEHLTNDLSFLIERPYLLTYQGTAQTGLADNTWHTITMDTVAGQVHGTPGDNYGGWVAGASNHYAAVVPGWYLVLGGYSQAALSATMSCIAGIAQSPQGLNTPDWYQQISTSATTDLPGAEAIGVYYLRAGDTVTPQYQETDGGTFATSVTTGHNSSFGLIWLSE